MKPHAAGLWRVPKLLVAAGLYLCPFAAMVSAGEVENDECYGATVVMLGSNLFDTSDATSSSDPWNDDQCIGTSMGIMNQDVWFLFSPRVDGAYDIHTCSSGSFDTDLVIYEGDCEEMVQIACNGDGAGLPDCQTWYSMVDGVPMSSGSFYLVRVGGWSSSDAGPGALHISQDIPGNCCLAAACTDNVPESECLAMGGIYMGDGNSCEDSPCPVPSPDECVLAAPITVGESDFSTIGATDSNDPYDPDGCDSLGVMSNDVWFTFTPEGSGEVSLSTCDAGSFDTDLVVYEGDCEEMIQVACSGDSTGLPGCQAYYSYIEALEVVAGETYYVRIGAWGQGVSGTGVLAIDGELDPGPASCPADLDGSGSVGFDDLMILYYHWGECSPGEDCTSDLDGDGRVAFYDLLMMLATWGECT